VQHRPAIEFIEKLRFCRAFRRNEGRPSMPAAQIVPGGTELTCKSADGPCPGAASLMWRKPRNLQFHQITTILNRPEPQSQT
jgi:hypothetical protein